MSTTRKQQIRPRFVDLAEFDDEQLNPAQHGHEGGAGNAFDWPAAATVVRKPPPSIGSSKLKAAAPPAETCDDKPTERADPASEAKGKVKSKVVRIAPESANQVQHIQSNAPRQPSRFAQRRASASSSASSDAGPSATGFSFGPSSQPSRRPPADAYAGEEMPSRFTLDLDGGGGGASEAQGSGWGSNGPVEAGAPLIGAISERRPASAGASRGDCTPDKPKPRSGSRFMASRQMDADVRSANESRAASLARVKTWQDQAPGTGFPAVTRRDLVEPILPRSGGERGGSNNYSEDLSTAPAPAEDTQAQATAALRVDGDGDDDEEWLDETGRPMSAFRKSRLLKQGLRPPAIRRKDGGVAGKARPDAPMANPDNGDDDDDDGRGYVRDPTRDPGGGADPESITAMLASVSAENDKKIKAMDAREVEEELRSLEALFGKNVLDALRSRKPASSALDAPSATVGKPSQEPGTEVEAQPTRPPPATLSIQADVEAAAVGLHEPEWIRRRYFPGEPEGRNASLEWMAPMPASAPPTATADRELAEPRFDFDGRLVDRGIDTDKTYISGLHHHGDDQETPGYTASELLHLARSSVAAQRQLALNVLGRICYNYPLSQSRPDDDARDRERLPPADRATYQARTLIAARWLLQDRNFTVRSAALRCIGGVLRAGPAGEEPVQGATLLVDWSRLGLARSDQGSAAARTKKDRDDMAFEDIVKADWVDFLIGSGFLDLCVEKTGSLVASSWDARMLLEVLWRMASCSADRAQRIVGAEEKPMRDLVVELGLKATWPPSGAAAARSVEGSMEWPSLSAVRLLHLGILADRESAKAMVLDGTVDHLLRFVMLFPWKLEEDVQAHGATSGDAAVKADAHDNDVANADADADAEGEHEHEHELIRHAYELFATCLDVYAALGLYGQYASVAGRTWSVWNDVGSWVNRLLQQGLLSDAPRETAAAAADLCRAKVGVVERYFCLLETWTVCAKDPHQLLSHHDITWTQVRDWVEASCDAASHLSATVKGGSGGVRAARIAGALCGHLVAWVDCCKGKQPDLVRQKRAAIEAALGGAAVAVLGEVKRLEPDALRPDELEGIALLCTAASNVMRLTKALREFDPEATQTATDPSDSTEAAFASLAWKLFASSKLWTSLSSATARATGAYSYRSAIVHFAKQTLSATSDSAVDQLILLPALDGADRTALRKVALGAMQRFVGAEGVEILAPFVDEYVCGGHHEARRSKVLARSRWSLDVHPGSDQLVDRTTLFYRIADVADLVAIGSADRRGRNDDVSDDAQGEEESGDVDGDDDDEVDPLTKSPFWCSPALSLPLRLDWPLLALDDLLHSANSAVFNRADNLPATFQANEEAIVETSLELAIGVFTALLQRYRQTEDAAVRGALLRALPTAEQVRLAICKLLMLEHGQNESFVADKEQRRLAVAGAITGRDLFRQPAIASCITALLDLADELVALPLHDDDGADAVAGSRGYEAWTKHTMGHETTSFYTLFTDLLGLYDAISFGDANFARLVMTLASTASGLAAEYRKLLWNDYSLCLASMRIPLGAGTTRWWGDVEDDRDVLLHYARYVASAREARYVPYRVALWHCAHHLAPLWDGGADSDEAVKRAIQLAKVVGQERWQEVATYDYEAEEQGATDVVRRVDEQQRTKRLEALRARCK
ncbi:hypothetical protein ACQY0O_004044 [Thecaphora frezii]